MRGGLNQSLVYSGSSSKIKIMPLASLYGYFLHSSGVDGIMRFFCGGTDLTISLGVGMRSFVSIHFSNPPVTRSIGYWLKIFAKAG